MGYFSELDLVRKEEYVDRSYHGFEEQLLWRYEDLLQKCKEFSKSNIPITGDDYFSKDDYRYTPIEYFTTLRDVWRALEVAKEDLESKCGIVVRDDGSIENAGDDAEDPDQINIFEIVLLPTWFQTAVAA